MRPWLWNYHTACKHFKKVKSQELRVPLRSTKKKKKKKSCPFSDSQSRLRAKQNLIRNILLLVIKKKKKKEDITNCCKLQCSPRLPRGRTCHRSTPRSDFANLGCQQGKSPRGRTVLQSEDIRSSAYSPRSRGRMGLTTRDASRCYWKAQRHTTSESRM